MEAIGKKTWVNVISMGIENKLWLGRLQTYAEKRGVSKDLIDWSSMDSTLNYNELKTIIRELISSKIPDILDNFQSWQDRNEAQEQESQNEHIKQEEERILTEIKENVNTDLDAYYSQLYDYTKVVQGSEWIHGLVLIGSPAIGKTRQIMRKMNDIVLIAGHITPLSLFLILSENPNKTIVIDDPSDIWRNLDSHSILLQALQTEKKRFIRWQSTILEKLKKPPIAEFNGKVVIIANEIPNGQEVLLSRCLLRRLAFSFEQRAKLLVAFSKQEGIYLPICEHAIKLCNSANQDRVNFRLLLKANEFHKQNLDWASFLMEELEIDEVTKVFLEVEAKPLSVNDKIKEFRERTGYSRRSYFLYKKVQKVQGII